MYTLQIPETVVCGQDAIKQLFVHIQEAQVRKIGLLIDGAVYSQPAVCELVNQLYAYAESLTIVTDIPAEPSVAQVIGVYDALQKDADGVELLVAIGGGSTLDTAKIISAMLTNPTYRNSVTDVSLITQKPCPLYMAPTSAGTGAEATINAIVLIPEKKVKQGVIHPWFLPQKVFLDPILTQTLPPSLTAATGLDAFCHCIETYMSLCHTPFGRLYALEGLRLISRYLLRAYRWADDMEAREGMMLAAFYGGVAIRCSSTVAIHALSYPLGGTYHIPHGVANAMLLPHVMAFNIDALNSDELCAIADAMALEVPHDNRRAMEEGIVSAIYSLIHMLSIPQKLSDFGVSPTDLDALVESAFGVRRLLDQNPKPMTKEQIAQIYRKLF